MIYRDRWHDRNFVDLTWDEKAMYQMVESFDGITAAGVIRAEPGILAQKHPDKDASDIETYLGRLADKGWVKRSGSEVFVISWFIRQPAQIKSDRNLKAIQSAINRIGYDDLRANVIQALFDAILEVARIDGAQPSTQVRQVCQEIAEQHDVELPTQLAGSNGKRG